MQNSFAMEDFQKVDIRQAIEIANQNNLDILSSRLNLDIAKNDIKTSNRLQNPEINIFYNFGRSGKGNPQQIGMSEVIELGKRDARKKLAKSNLLLTEDKLQYTEFDLQMDVRKSYIDLVTSKAILGNIQSQQKLFEDLVAIVEKKVQSGELPEVDLMQAKIALNKMITQVNTSKTNVRTKTLEFNKVINSKSKNYDSIDDFFPDLDNFSKMMTPTPNIKFPEFDKIAKNTLEQRSDIKIAKQEVDIAQKNLSLIIRQRIPDIEISAGYAYQTKKLSDDGTFRAGAYTALNIVNIPLFYNYSPEIKNAQIKAEQARLNYESTENKAIKDLQKAYEQFLTSKDNLNYYHENLIKTSQEMINISKKDYEQGRTNLTSLIVMQQSYEDIMESYTNAIAEYYNSWLEFLREVNSDNFNIETEDI